MIHLKPGPKAWRWPALLLLFLLGGQLMALNRLATDGSAVFLQGGPFRPASGSGGVPSVPTIGDPSRETYPSTTIATGPGPMTGISVPARRPVVAAPPPASTPGAGAATSAPPRPAALPPVLPADGVYVYRLSGSEAASLFGRRSYPSTMSVAVHRAPDVGPGAAVLDHTFSAEHTERQVLASTGDGTSLRFEGGRIAFGMADQTSQAAYDPPLLQHPRSLDVGTRRAGSSVAREPGGAVARVEDWSVAVVGREPVDVGGRIVDTVVIETHRQSRPGTSDQLTRDRRVWLDPSRALAVRWTERFTGSRTLGPVSFTYETEYTATLATLPG